MRLREGGFSPPPPERGPLSPRSVSSSSPHWVGSLPLSPGGGSGEGGEGAASFLRPGARVVLAHDFEAQGDPELLSAREGSSVLVEHGDFGDGWFLAVASDGGEERSGLLPTSYVRAETPAVGPRGAARAPPSPPTSPGAAAAPPGAAAAAAAASAEDEGGVRSVSLPRPPSPEALAEEARWLGDVMCFHLDEEWTPLEVHRRLGDRLAEVYARVREGDGGDEVGAVIMSLTEELLSFNFREAFVSRFEVANKAGEVLMMRAGMDVCCTSPDDESLLERFSAHQQAEAEATGGGGGSP